MNITEKIKEQIDLIQEKMRLFLNVPRQEIENIQPLNNIEQINHQPILQPERENIQPVNNIEQINPPPILQPQEAVHVPVVEPVQAVGEQPLAIAPPPVEQPDPDVAIQPPHRRGRRPRRPVHVNAPAIDDNYIVLRNGRRLLKR